MDHIELPLKPSHEPVEMPYFCSEQYNVGQFLTHPKRRGWTNGELLNPCTWDRDIHVLYRYVYDSEYRQSPVHSLEEKSSFLQSWLYFGLLHSFFGGSPDHDDFVRKGVGGKPIVTTSKLRIYGDDWLARIRDIKARGDAKGIPIEQSELQHEWRTLNLCLRTASDQMSIICNEASISPPLLLSSGLLGEYLTKLKLRAFLGGEVTGFHDSIGLPKGDVPGGAWKLGSSPSPYLRERKASNFPAHETRRVVP